MIEIAAYLWLCAIADSGARYCDIHPMPTMAVCQDAIKTARIDSPSGGDMQTQVVILCTDNRDLYWSNGSQIGTAKEIK